MPPIEWLNEPADFAIMRGTLNVWRLIVKPDQSVSPALWKFLSIDEKERANRFVFDKDRNMFVAVRATLRNLLARYCNTEPETLKFDYNTYGKPFLQYPQVGIHFNVSHSRHLAVLIVAVQTVGIDVEFHDPKFASLQIAERFFSNQEVEELRSVPEDKFVKSFFDCWSRKESYIKAKGLGVSLALDSFTTRALSDDKAVLSQSRQYPNDVATMEIIPCVPLNAFSGAISAEKPVDNIFYFDCHNFITLIE